ncbi:MAG: hypothetical protein K9N07_03885 [Candidatus Cloacimonetes bacterium]|nr:hypothetical protein [Candidatus Cloacimonadota bacterium]
MRNFKLIVSGLIILLFLSGCFQVKRVIKVNKDGSGMIEETVLMSQEFIDQMKQMSSSMGGDKADTPDESAYHNVKSLKENAGSMGEGVKYVSSKPMKENGKLGYSVSYSFTDISQIKLDENPAENLMSTSRSDQEMDDVHFKFKPGKTAELTILFPTHEYKGDEDEEEEAEDFSEASEQDIKMMKAMYAGMKILVKVFVDGKIVETTASYKNGNEIILSDIDFDLILNNNEALNSFARGKDVSEDEMKKSMAKYPGFKTETNNKVLIKFK